MSDVFSRQSEAWDYVRSVSDQKDKLLLEIALGHALHHLCFDPDYQSMFERSPMDLLAYARAMHAFLSKHDTIRGVLDGTIQSIEDLSPFPTK